MDNQEFGDDLITQFCEIADTTPDVAKNYLSVADGILENAIQLFLSGFEIPKKADPLPIENNLDEGTSTNYQPSPVNDVRAPIAATTDILVDDYNYGSWQQPSYQQSFQSLDPFRDFSAETEEFQPSDMEDEETWNKSKKLSELYKAPYDIIFNGSFQEARDNAKQYSKWLLVNIQEPSEFSCQILNRDLWKNKDVKDLIRQHFVFIQYPITSREGQQYKQFYPFDKYPHISLVDPRTGERIKIWDKVVNADEFVSELLEFMIANNLNSSQPLKTDTSNEKSSSNIKNYDTMTEDEQIRAAIEMSIKDQNKNNEPTLIEDDEYFDDDYGEDDEFDSANNSQFDDSEDMETKSDSNGKNKKEEEEEEEEEDNNINQFEIDPSLSKDELCEKCLYFYIYFIIDYYKLLLNFIINI